MDELTILLPNWKYISTNHFRFAAAALLPLVGNRVSDLREVRIQVYKLWRIHQTAVGTAITLWIHLAPLTCCQNASVCSQLLRTRWYHIERQNQALLTSMALRAKMQLRMQQCWRNIDGRDHLLCGQSYRKMPKRYTHWFTHHVDWLKHFHSIYSGDYCHQHQTIHKIIANTTE